MTEIQLLSFEWAKVKYTFGLCNCSIVLTLYKSSVYITTACCGFEISLKVRSKHVHAGTNF